MKLCPGSTPAGMAEGGLCLWDLRENAANHPTETLISGSNPPDTSSASLCCRRPTYTTEAEGDAASAGPIIALKALPDQRSGMEDCGYMMPLTLPYITGLTAEKAAYQWSRLPATQCCTLSQSDLTILTCVCSEIAQLRCSQCT